MAERKESMKEKLQKAIELLKEIQKENYIDNSVVGGIIHHAITELEKIVVE